MFDKEAIQELTRAEAIRAAYNSISDAVTPDDRGTQAGLVALPNDFQIHDLEKSLPNRRRLRGTMNTSVIADFATYVTNCREDGATIFINQEEMAAVAILNLGSPAYPGHADNRAKLTPKRTAAYQALQQHANGSGHKQQTIAEFLEDWAMLITCKNDDGYITSSKAIAAVRNITIDAMRRLESKEQQLSATKSAFESVTATSADPLPTTIEFNCVPYAGFDRRVFVMRLGVLTSGDKPTISLRIINQEQHNEEMAQELSNRVILFMDTNKMPVLIGTYQSGT